MRKTYIGCFQLFHQSLVSVHVYNSVYHTYHFSTLILSWSLMSPDFSTFSSDVNADFAIPILRRTSSTHLPSNVNILPRYMILFTCSKLVPCIVILHVGMPVDFENTMVKNWQPFRYNPLFSLSRTTMSISCCNFLLFLQLLLCHQHTSNY